MKLETQDTIAANLRTLRITTRLSQAEIAANVGTSRPLYTHYELGDRTQDAEVLYNLAKFMNLEMEMLFEKDPQKFFAYIANRSDDEDLNELIRIYKQLSPYSKGMLMEKACTLLEKDSENSGSRLSVFERENFWTGGQP